MEGARVPGRGAPEHHELPRRPHPGHLIAPDEPDRPHDDPEPAWVRRGAPALGAVLAVVVFAGMLALTGGPAQTAVVVGALAASGVAVVVRGISRRRTGQPVDASVRHQQFWLLWPLQAGLTFLAAGEDTAASAAIYIATGLVFAGALTAFLSWMGPVDDEPIDDEPELDDAWDGVADDDVRR